eukprot:1138173-Pelagomonas_calceolata.AAC.2
MIRCIMNEQHESVLIGVKQKSLNHRSTTKQLNFSMHATKLGFLQILKLEQKSLKHKGKSKPACDGGSQDSQLHHQAAQSQHAII